MVRGRPRHVVGYLKEFLFAEAQARGPVSALSGGERARLLLALLMAQGVRTCWCSTSRPTTSTSRRSTCSRSWSATTRDGARSSATTATSSTGWRRRRSRWRATGGRWSMPAAGPTTGRSAAMRRRRPRRAGGAAEGARRRGRRRRRRRPRLSFTQAHRLEALPGEIDRLGGRDRQARGAARRSGALRPRAGEVRQGERGARRPAGGAGRRRGRMADARGAARGGRGGLKPRVGIATAARIAGPRRDRTCHDCPIRA